MASAEDIVKDLTKRVVRYIDTPKEERLKNRKDRVKEPWNIRWFGMIPFALSMWLSKWRRFGRFKGK
jgi:hypothetical protein